VGGLVGGIIGFMIGAVVYLFVNPMLEAATGPVRELQGLLWNLVPLLTATGSVVGWWTATRR
jgi:hypothetical protein